MIFTDTGDEILRTSQTGDTPHCYSPHSCLEFKFQFERKNSQSASQQAAKVKPNNFRLTLMKDFFNLTPMMTNRRITNVNHFDGSSSSFMNANKQEQQQQLIQSNCSPLMPEGELVLNFNLLTNEPVSIIRFKSLSIRFEWES